MTSPIYLPWERNKSGYEIVEIDPDLVDWNGFQVDIGEQERSVDDLAPTLSAAGKRALDLWGSRLLPFDYETYNEHQRKRAERYGETFESEAGPEHKMIRIISPVIRDTDTHNPLERVSELFMEFANIDLTEDGVVKFANKYGLLWSDRPPHLDGWYSEIRKMKEIVEAKGKRAKIAPERLTALFESNAPGDEFTKFSMPLTPVLNQDWEGFSVALQPQSLLDGMWLQLAFSISGKTSFVQCESCQNFLAISQQHNRSDKKFCSNRCRTRASRARSLKAKGSATRNTKRATRIPKKR